MGLFDSITNSKLATDLSNFGIADALGLAAFINQQEINKGLAKTNAQQAEWTQQAQLLTLQSQLAAQQASASGSSLLKTGGVIVVLLIIAGGVYYVIKS